jgi:AraC-like DNA-binding protein
MELQFNESLVFNYEEIFYTYLIQDDKRCIHMSNSHSLTYTYSGEMIIEERGRKTVIGKGECAFIKRDNRLIMDKLPKDGQPYQGIYMTFSRNFLRNQFQRLHEGTIPKIIQKFDETAIKLEVTAELESLFLSMKPYFDPSVKPREEFMQLKREEALFVLLNTDQKFYSTIFDFSEPWKIDILDFMNENYMYELSMEEIAQFTGRSLSTFKRDFEKISSLTPQKWLINKRLETALHMLQNENKKVSEVYVNVGFKNVTHFYAAFKKQYGFSPKK